MFSTNKDKNSHSVKFKWNENGDQCKIHESLIVDKIIDPDHINEDKENYILKPQAIINLILKGKNKNDGDIEFSKNEIGLLFPKIGKYREGLWVIEPGFIHPNYKGKISVHVCNLSKVPILISKNDKILELVTIEINSSDKNNHGKDKQIPTPEEYDRSRRAEALKFPNNFLDIEENMKRITKDVGIDTFRNMLIVVIAFFSLIVGASGWLNWNIADKIYKSIIDNRNLEDVDIRNEIKEQIRLEVLRQTGHDPQSNERDSRN